MSIYYKEAILSDAQYNKEETHKSQIVIHHTAGGGNPLAVVSGWESNADKIGAHNVIGRTSTKNDTTFDGKIVKAIDSKYWAWHIGLKLANDPTKSPHGYYDSRSIGIEVCNWGGLTLKQGKYIHYLNGEVPADQVCDLGFEFRGYRYFHKYTQAQLASLFDLIHYHCRNEGITLRKRVFTVKDFELNIPKFGVEAIAMHVNYRADKNDMSPQPELIAMLNSL